MFCWKHEFYIEHSLTIQRILLTDGSVIADTYKTNSPDKFSVEEAPYLAVISHGNSGNNRSVLLIFNPHGKLVWQEELIKLSSILAIPDINGSREKLLIAGRDGIFEYALTGQATLNKGSE